MALRLSFRNMEATNEPAIKVVTTHDNSCVVGTHRAHVLLSLGEPGLQREACRVLLHLRPDGGICLVNLENSKSLISRKRVRRVLLSDGDSFTLGSHHITVETANNKK